MILRSSLVSMALLGLIACAPIPRMTEDCAEPGSRVKDQIQVRLEVFEDSLGDHHLLVIEPSQCASNPTQKGCVTVPNKRVGEMTFHLKDGRGQNCQGNGTVKWRLQGVQMSMQAKDTGGTVTDAVRCDFDTDNDGHVLNPVFPGGPRMKILDRNNEEYDVYYTVSAVSCDTGEVITTDPWIENKGSS